MLGCVLLINAKQQGIFCKKVQMKKLGGKMLGDKIQKSCPSVLNKYSLLEGVSIAYSEGKADC